MKEFFRSLLASMVALGCFSGAVLILLLVIVASMGPSTPVVPKKSVLVFDLDTSIPDSAQESGPGEAIQRAISGGIEESTPLPVLIKAIDRAAQDKDIAALYLSGNLRSSGGSTGYGALIELKQAIERFKATSGKPVLAYNQFWGKREYFLCSGAATIYSNPFGVVEVLGPSVDILFYAGFFKKYGIEVQVTRVGKYKSYVEPYILEKMSDANREEYQKLIGDLWGEWKTTVAADRRLQSADIQRMADEKGLLTSQEAQQAGLVDKQAYYDEVLDQLKTLTGKTAKDKTFAQIDLTDYAKISGESGGKNRIAVVYAEGDIVDGEGAPNQVGADRIARELRELRLDSHVKAVVLRVNSPGGSVTASENIQREVVATRKEKPVVVSMGSAAASGGYWISAYSDRIFAEPSTITGSIGVFGLFPNIKKLANDHGLNWDGIQAAKLAMPSLGRPRSSEELARLQTLVDQVYDQFIAKVAEGRKLEKGVVQEIAQGRVWSGREALKLGLVDEVGGLMDAVKYAAKLAKVENDFRMDAPELPRSFVERLLHAAGGSEKRRLARAGLGDQLKSELERQIRLLNSLNDPQGIYARMPVEFEIH